MTLELDHSPSPPPSIALRADDVSEHAALRWGRRVLQDPRLDDWRQDGRVTREVSPVISAAIADARSSLVAIAPTASVTAERAEWMKAPTREAPGGVFLMVGDDIAVVVARLDGEHWTAVTILVKHHPDSPYTYEQRRERRRRQRERRPASKPQAPRQRYGPRRERTERDAPWAVDLDEPRDD